VDGGVPPDTETGKTARRDRFRFLVVVGVLVGLREWFDYSSRGFVLVFVLVNDIDDGEANYDSLQGVGTRRYQRRLAT
jgi:hypothetical protein